MSTPDKKILIVENEEDLSEALSTVLTQEGFEVIVSNDGEKGLRDALHHKPDLIILDLMLPKMDGLTVLKNLREDNWGCDVAVIVMTAFDDPEKVVKVARYGVGDYIVKTNITLANVVAKVRLRLEM